MSILLECLSTCGKTYNNIFSDVGFDSEVLGDYLSTDNIIKKLELWDGCDSEDIAYVAAGMKSNTSVTSLDLSHNNIDVNSAESLRDILVSNTTLKELVLNSCIFRPGAFGILCEGLERNTTLVSLFLDYLPIIHYGNINVQELSITNIRLNSAMLREILSNTNLKSLDLSTSEIDPDAFPIIINALNQLRELHIGCCFTREQVKTICTELENNTNLESLSLDSTDLDMSDIHEMLEKNTTLTSLNLNWVNMTDDDFLLLMKTNLTELALCVTPVRDFSPLKDNTSLVKLTISNPDDIFKTLCVGLETNTTLKILSIYDTLHEEDFYRLARVFLSNNTLERIIIEESVIGDSTVVDRLIASLQSNYMLKKIKNLQCPRLEEFLSEEQRSIRYNRLCCKKSARAF